MFLVKKMKKVFKVSIILFLLIFFGIFLSYKNGYYIKRNNENSLYTEEKIREYENDLKNGVDVTKKNYLDIKEDYDNNYTRFSLKLSKRIEQIFDKTIKFIFKKIGNTINE